MGFLIYLAAENVIVLTGRRRKIQIGMDFIIYYRETVKQSELTRSVRGTEAAGDKARK